VGGGVSVGGGVADGVMVGVAETAAVDVGLAVGVGWGEGVSVGDAVAVGVAVGDCTDRLQPASRISDTPKSRILVLFTETRPETDRLIVRQRCLAGCEQEDSTGFPPIRTESIFEFS